VDWGPRDGLAIAATTGAVAFAASWNVGVLCTVGWLIEDVPLGFAVARLVRVAEAVLETGKGNIGAEQAATSHATNETIKTEIFIFTSISNCIDVSSFVQVPSNDWALVCDAGCKEGFDENFSSLIIWRIHFVHLLKITYFAMIARRAKMLNTDFVRNHNLGTDGTFTAHNIALRVLLVSR